MFGAAGAQITVVRDLDILNKREIATGEECLHH